MSDLSAPSRKRRGAAYGGEVDVSTPAVVLKLSRGSLHHGALGAIRSLGRIGVQMYAVPGNRWDPVAGSRYLRGKLSWRPDPESPSLITARLRALADRIGQPAVIIPTDEASAIYLAEHGDPLRGRFLFPQPPARLPRQVADKSSLHRICQDLGVPTPRTATPESFDDARKFAADVGYPVVVKLAAAWRAIGSHLPSSSLVATERELGRAYDACEHAGAKLIVQERVPGVPGNDWFFDGYCAADSTCLAAFTGLKQQVYPADAGVTSACRGERNTRLQDQVCRMLARLSYRGIVDLDLRLDPRTGEYVLLDFNPRLGSQARASVDQAGLDVTLAAYLDLTGQRAPVSDQVDGRRLLVENQNLIYALGARRDGAFSWKTWLSSVRGADEKAWFAADDLRPFVHMCARMAFHAVSEPALGRRRVSRKTAAAE